MHGIRNRNNQWISGIKGGVIPNEFIPSVNKGIVKTMDRGVLAGFPVVDVKVVLLDGSHHAKHAEQQ